MCFYSPFVSPRPENFVLRVPLVEFVRGLSFHSLIVFWHCVSEQSDRRIPQLAHQLSLESLVNISIWVLSCYRAV